jgi:hypothetical protein
MSSKAIIGLAGDFIMTTIRLALEALTARRSRKVTHWPRKTVDHRDQNILRHLFDQILLQRSFHQPQVRRLPQEGGPVNSHSNLETTPKMPKEVVVQPTVRVDAQELPHNFFRQQFRITQPRLRTAHSQALIS